MQTESWCEKVLEDLKHPTQRILIPTVYKEDVVIVGFPHSVRCHAAIGAVVGFVEVLDVEVRAGDDGVRRHILIHSQPVDLMGAGEHKYHTHHSGAVCPC